MCRFFFNTIKRSKQISDELEADLREKRRLALYNRIIRRWSRDYIVFSRNERRLYKKCNYNYVQKFFKVWRYQIDDIQNMNRKEQMHKLRRKKIMMKKVFFKLKAHYFRKQKLLEKMLHFNRKVASRH